MASGHVNRTYTPNTWSAPTNAAYVKKALASPEPSTHGTKLTCHPVQCMSADEG